MPTVRRHVHVVVIVVGFLCGWELAELWRVTRPDLRPRLLLLGNSRTRTGVDPAIVERSLDSKWHVENYGTQGQTLVQALSIIEQEHPAIAVVDVTCDLHRRGGAGGWRTPTACAYLVQEGLEPADLVRRLAKQSRWYNKDRGYSPRWWGHANHGHEGDEERELYAGLPGVPVTPSGMPEDPCRVNRILEAMEATGTRVVPYAFPLGNTRYMWAIRLPPPTEDMLVDPGHLRADAAKRFSWALGCALRQQLVGRYNNG